MSETVTASYHLQEVTKLEAEIERLQNENNILRADDREARAEATNWKRIAEETTVIQHQHRLEIERLKAVLREIVDRTGSNLARAALGSACRMTSRISSKSGSKSIVLGHIDL